MTTPSQYTAPHIAVGRKELTGSIPNEIVDVIENASESFNGIFAGINHTHLNFHRDDLLTLVDKAVSTAMSR